MSDSSIEWTNKTWNPVRGCRRVSPGCENCYAETMAARNLPEMRSPTTGKPFAMRTPAGPRWTGAVELIPSKLAEPLHWKKPQRVFVNSMSDLFHELLTNGEINRVFATMARAPQHTFQVLTKRPARMLEYFAWARVANATVKQWPLPNVWLGVSVEDQATADERIPLLLQTPAAVRFISYEPALGPVDVGRFMWPVHERWPGIYRSPDEARAAGATVTKHRQALVSAYARFVDWVIVGGESGPGARPFDIAWARSTVAQCKAAGVPVFVKQLGARPIDPARLDAEPDRPGDTIHDAPTLAQLDRLADLMELGMVRLKNRKGGDPSEWPAGDWPREFPKGAAA